MPERTRRRRIAARAIALLPMGLLAASFAGCSSDDAAPVDAGSDAPVPAKFTVTAVPRAVLLARGGPAVPVTVTVERRPDFFDALTITPVRLPDGVTALPLVIGPGETTGTLVLSAPTAAEGVTALGAVEAVSGPMRTEAQLEVTTREEAPLPDPTFGIGGKMRIGAGVAREELAAAALQADGKLVAVGSYRTGYTTVPAVARYLTTGALDATFGAGGVVLFDTHDGAAANGVAIQADGKIVVLEANDFTLTRLGPTGAVDATFAGGVVSAAFPNEAMGAALAIQPDGKIVVAGSALGTDRDFALARFSADGTLDATFGTGGRVTTSVAVGDDGATSLALETNAGQTLAIVAAGSAATATGRQLAVARYLPAAGALDAAFDGDGIATYTSGATEDVASGVTVAAGKVLAVGRRRTGTSDELELVRFTAAGALDATLAGTGVKTLALGASASANAVVVSAGKILVAGVVGTNPEQGILARLDDAGGLDVGFGAGGTLTAAFGDTTTVRGLVVAADGTASLVGTATQGSDPDAFVARFTAAGLPEAGFGGGRVTTSFGPGDEEVRALAVQPDGKIIAAGSAYNGRDFDFMVARVLPTGILDPTFAERGFLRYDHSKASEFVYDVRVLPDGRIVAGGQGGPGSLVLGLTAAGTVDPGFGTGGVAAIGGGDGFGMSLQAPGPKIVVGGPSSGGDFFAARLTPQGTLDTSGAPGVGFGGSGTFTTDFGLADRAIALTVDPAGKVVLVGHLDRGAPPNFFDLAIARYEPSGAPDPTFGTEGRVTLDTGNVELLYAVAVQPDDKTLIAGRMQRPTRATSLGILRVTKNGALDTDFGLGGRASTDLADGSQASALLVEPSGMIVVAGRSEDDRMALLRLSPSGAPLWPRGFTSVAFGARAEAFAVARPADGQLLVGGVGRGRLDDQAVLVRFAK